MALYLKEFVGSKSEQVIWNYTPEEVQKPDLNLTEGTFSSVGGLHLLIEGIHSVITRNDTFYTDNAMKKSESLWVHPYLRPMILNHNEVDGKIVGRIHDANFAHSNKSGTGCLNFDVVITDEDTKEQVHDKRLLTTSIGVIVHDCKCSICNQNLATDGMCEHERGETYEGKRCYWIIEEFEPKELSFVIVPSDIYSAIVKINEINRNTFFEAANNAANSISISEGLNNIENIKEEPKKMSVELQEKLSTAEAKLVTSEAKLITAEAKLATVEQKIETTEASLSTEKILNQELQAENQSLRESLIESLVESVCRLRKSLGRESNSDALKQRTAEVLQSNIEDLKEELAVKEAEDLEAAKNVEPEGVKPVVTTAENLINTPKIENKEALIDGKQDFNTGQESVKAKDEFDLQKEYDNLLLG